MIWAAPGGDWLRWLEDDRDLPASLLRIGYAAIRVVVVLFSGPRVPALPNNLSRQMLRPKPKVFVAHSTRNDAAEAALKEVLEALTATGIQVVVDREFMGDGNDIPPMVMAELMSASGGIVVLSKEAATQSNWVPFEAFLMALRKMLQGDEFPLLILELDEGAVENLATQYPGLNYITRVKDLLARKNTEQSDIVTAVKRVFSVLSVHDNREDPLLDLKAQVRVWLEDDVGDDMARRVQERNLPAEAQSLDDLRKGWAWLGPRQVQMLFTEWLFSPNAEVLTSAIVLTKFGVGARAKDIVETAALKSIRFEDAAPVRCAALAERKVVSYRTEVAAFARQIVRRAFPGVAGDGWYLSDHEPVLQQTDRRRSGGCETEYETAAVYWKSNEDLVMNSDMGFTLVSVVRAPINAQQEAAFEAVRHSCKKVLFVLYAGADNDAITCVPRGGCPVKYIDALKGAAGHFRYRRPSL